MFLGFRSVLWLSDSYAAVTPPTLTFSIFEGFCLNISIFFSFYPKFCSQSVKMVSDSKTGPILGCDVSELHELISECEHCWCQFYSYIILIIES